LSDSTVNITATSAFLGDQSHNLSQLLSGGNRAIDKTGHVRDSKCHSSSVKRSGDDWIIGGGSFFAQSNL